MKIKHLRTELVEFIPEHLEEGVLYISDRYRTAVHRCCCGCGQEVVTPLSPAEWSVTYNGKRASLWPSIGNWSLPCRSHYIIRDGRVLEAKAMTPQQILRVKENDRAEKAAQIRRTNHAKEAAALAPKPNAKITNATERRTSTSCLQRLIRWWRSL